MIQAKISTFQTVKYVENELSKMTRDEQLSVKNFGYEKIIKETELVNQTFKDVGQLRSKIFELCQENRVIFVVLENYTSDGLLVGGKYRLNDPNAIFEIIFFTILDMSKHTKSAHDNIEKAIINDPNIKELCRIIGKDMHEVTYYDSQYASLHRLPNSLYAISNLIYDNVSTWSKANQSRE
jgi:hypothetical protein